MESLPPELLRIVLDSLLFYDLVNMDLAFQQSSLVYSTYLRGMCGYVHNSKIGFDTVRTHLDWIHRMKIFFKKLIVAVNTENLKAITHFSPHITEMTVSLGSDLKDDSQVPLCPQLTSISFVSFLDGQMGFFSAFLAAHPRIREVRLDRLSRSCMIEAVDLLGKYCPHIEYLSLPNTDVRDSDIVIMVQKCRQLKYLDMTAANINEGSLRLLFDSYPHLHYFGIRTAAISPVMCGLLLQRVIFPSLFNSSSECQLLALKQLVRLVQDVAKEQTTIAHLLINEMKLSNIVPRLVCLLTSVNGYLALLVCQLLCRYQQLLRPLLESGLIDSLTLLLTSKSSIINVPRDLYLHTALDLISVICCYQPQQIATSNLLPSLFHKHKEFVLAPLLNSDDSRFIIPLLAPYDLEFIINYALYQPPNPHSHIPDRRLVRIIHYLEHAIDTDDERVVDVLVDRGVVQTWLRSQHVSGQIFLDRFVLLIVCKMITFREKYARYLLELKEAEPWIAQITNLS